MFYVQVYMGQINPESSMGRVLEQLAADSSYSTYVEVGTWNGLGTTRCLMNGMKRRKIPGEIWSYEAHPDMYTTALQNWSQRPSYLHIQYGTLHRQISSLESIRDHPGIQTIVRGYGNGYTEWHAGEKRSLFTAPLVEPPACIDVVVLDGGEFTTQGDWDILKTRNPRVVALDDTMVFKTHDIRKELLQSPEWMTLHDEPTERNGWAVFKRIDVFQNE